MHSSRMHTTRLLTVSRIIRGKGCLPGGLCIPACNGADTPPLNKMIDMCKNITLPQTSFAGGKYINPSYCPCDVCDTMGTAFLLLYLNHLNS